MRYFISTDMEGLNGISTFSQITRGNYGYHEACQQLTREINAVCNGLKRADDKAEILVCDSHDNGNNIIMEELEHEIEVLLGPVRTYYMVEGLEQLPKYDVLMLIGYHAPVGTQAAMMDHTYSARSVREIRINGEVVDEADIAVFMAGHYDIPIGFASGDDKLIIRVEQQYRNINIHKKEQSPVCTVVSKRSVSRFRTQMKPRQSFLQQMEDQAYQMAKSIDLMPIIRPTYPIESTIELTWTNTADWVSLIPTIERTGGTTIRFSAPDMPAFYRALMTIISMGSIANQSQ